MVRTPLFLLCAAGAAAFAPQSSVPVAASRSASASSVLRAELGDEVKSAAEKFTEPGRNPNNPALPELKGDYDWDEKFANDPDWITDNVPNGISFIIKLVSYKVHKLFSTCSCSQMDMIIDFHGTIEICSKQPRLYFIFRRSINCNMHFECRIK